MPSDWATLNSLWPPSSYGQRLLSDYPVPVWTEPTTDTISFRLFPHEYPLIRIPNTIMMTTDTIDNKSDEAPTQEGYVLQKDREEAALVIAEKVSKYFSSPIEFRITTAHVQNTLQLIEVAANYITMVAKSLHDKDGDYEEIHLTVGYKNYLNRITRASECLESLKTQLDTYQKKTEEYKQRGEGDNHVRQLDKEIANIPAELTGVRLNDRHSLCATTPTINLEGVELGRFEIKLLLNNTKSGNITNNTHNWLRVEALDPNPCKKNEEVTHPHVEDNHLCTGDGEEALQAAIAEGRISDVFEIVLSILETYNDDSPYERIEDWLTGPTIPCYECDERIVEDDANSCTGCDHYCCDGCMSTCNCNSYFCAGCQKRCDRCGVIICDGCLYINDLGDEDGENEDLCERCYKALEAEQKKKEAAAAKEVIPPPPPPPPPPEVVVPMPPAVLPSAVISRGRRTRTCADCEGRFTPAQMIGILCQECAGPANESNNDEESDDE